MAILSHVRGESRIASLGRWEWAVWQADQSESESSFVSSYVFLPGLPQVMDLPGIMMHVAFLSCQVRVQTYLRFCTRLEFGELVFNGVFLCLSA